MGAFLAKYWLEFVLGLIAMGITFAVKSHFSWALKKRKEEQKQLVEEIVNQMKEEVIAEGRKLKTASDEADFSIEEEIGMLNQDFNLLKKGILSIQGRQFKEFCTRLLSSDHELTLDEYRQCSDEHEVYNCLGGNHDGDRLFALVQKKAENLFSKDDE